MSFVVALTFSSLCYLPAPVAMVYNAYRYLVGLLSLQLTLPGTVLGSPFPSGSSYRPSLAKGHLGAVASESEICSHVGTELLKKGGNAADALVGTVACVGVVGMYHSGLGGGGFMIVRAPNGTYEFIDFRETAPAAAFEDMYNNNEEASISGGLASGVPGELRGLQHLHENYGILPWETVLTPAVKVAREGWTVNEDLVNYMKSATSGASDTNSSNFLVFNPQFAMDFAPKGRLVRLNETITRKRYADTLETVAQQGPDAFYEGPIAEATIRALQAQNGTMTLADLKNYTVALRKPSSITYRDYKLTSCSAPSGGEVALAVLKIMEGYSGVGDASNVNLTTHRLDEAMRFGYGERSNLGDPLFLDGIDEYQEQMISEKTAAEVRSKISDTRTFNVSYYDPAGLESLETPGTSHIVTADYTGLSISLTTTVNLLFGSQLVVPETGVIMNNEMNDFSIPNVTNAFGYIPSPANFIRPGKRPLSSISPVIVEHLNSSSLADALYVSIGAAGGSRIITATIQNLIHILDGGLTTHDALAQPRIHDQLVPAYVSFEYAFDNSTVAFLEELGHNVTWVAPGQSTAQGLRRLKGGLFEAAGEPRQHNSGGFVV
ncbi:gamma-glutamyltranspeptidase-like protein [Lophiostoma macrostomum CBS 122681]|uniref:Glutathione hydrolase n=1 Tax=Lophiostoma macrostomum CBS 122681 TaxID=1314788 RepID=A0A6A6TDF1_9PLEO|nr:gamma-glutamyltranspeptidase-like protein [Lophiostoma macrostomum CBS 122681]